MTLYDTNQAPPVKRQQVAYVCALDLAQQEDYSALSVLECKRPPEAPRMLSLVHLDRWQATYPRTHERTLETLLRPPLPGRCVLAIDATGVGLSFYETFRLDPHVRELLGDDRIMPVIIVSGSGISRKDRFLHVGKHRIISGLHRELASKTLRITAKLPLRAELFTELDGFESRVRDSGTRSFGNNATLVAHDDLVLSVALAVVAARAAFGELDQAS